MEQYASILRGIANRLNLMPVRKLAKLPGVQDVYRITIHYSDMRASDTVATLQRDSGAGVVLEVIYYGRFGNKPLYYQWDIKRYELFVNAIRPSKFDKLYDQSIIPKFGEELCLFERGAGGFVKSVMFTPQRATGEYADLMVAITRFIPEVVREIT